MQTKSLKELTLDLIINTQNFVSKRIYNQKNSETYFNTMNYIFYTLVEKYEYEQFLSTIENMQDDFEAWFSQRSSKEELKYRNMAFDHAKDIAKSMKRFAA